VVFRRDLVSVAAYASAAGATLSSGQENHLRKVLTV
jgi:hypothetical protein